MSLRDELGKAIEKAHERPGGREPILFTNELLDAVMPIIERALAAERGALKADIYDRLTQPLTIERFAKELHELDTDRSALDALLAQARAEGERAMFDQFWDLAACCYGAPAGKHSPASLLDALADQARAEQREKNATEIVHAIEFTVEWTIKQLSEKKDWPASWDAGFPSYKGGALLAYQAHAIRAQKD